MENKPEYFEDQLDEIDAIDTPELDLETPEEPPKHQMTPAETRKAIANAMKNKEISRSQGEQLLRSLNMMPPKTNNKKVVSANMRKKKRSIQKKARKANR